MVASSPHDAYRFNNHRPTAAAIMAPSVMPQGLEAFPGGMLQPGVPFEQMTFTMSQLALTPPHLGQIDPALVRPSFQPAYTPVPPFTAPVALHRGAGSGSKRGIASQDERFNYNCRPHHHAPPPPIPPPLPPVPVHAARDGQRIFLSPHMQHLRASHTATSPSWSPVTPLAHGQPRRMNARVPSTLNSHKVCYIQHCIHYVMQ
jgi:hypothetical protein